MTAMTAMLSAIVQQICSFNPFQQEAAGDIGDSISMYYAYIYIFMHYSRALFATYFQWGCWIKEDLCKVINMDSELPGWPEVLLSEKNMSISGSFLVPMVRSFWMDT